MSLVWLKDLGIKIADHLKNNSFIEEFDIRNCEILFESKHDIDLTVLNNREAHTRNEL